MNVNVLKANTGDCIHVSFHDEGGMEFNILIDSGKKQTYRFSNSNKKTESGDLTLVIDELRRREKIFDLVILTHVDEDHIGGFISWIENDPYAFKMIGEVWFNSGNVIKKWLNVVAESRLQIMLDLSISSKTSIGQGVQFEEYLNDHKLWKGEIILAGMKKHFHGITFEFLSPDKQRLEDLFTDWKKERPDSLTAKVNDHAVSLKDHHAINKLVTDKTFKEDDAVPNGSSIAFLLSYKKYNLLFLADAFPSVVVKSLEDLGFSEKEKIRSELVKVAHHGSQSNTSPKLLRMIDSENFIISTNSKQDYHPHKKLLSLLIDHHPNCRIYFNYGELVDRIFTKQDHADFNFEALTIIEPFKYE